MSRMRSALLSCCIIAGLGSSAAPAVAAPGPALTVTSEQVDQSLECSGPLAGLTRDPVLLTPAFSTVDQSYGWNYRRQLPAVGITTCSLNLPDRGFGDLQVSAEYVVQAVRRLSAATGGRKVVLMGHQHGALNELWALRFWPDLAAQVSDFISLATPYHGTSTSASSCRMTKSCPPSAWQISTGSKFLAALNAAPIPAGPSYTSIATQFDELIRPQPTTSRLAGASNIVLQGICPLRPIEHFTILGDALTYRLVLDALNHPGPASATRVARTLPCLGATYMPGVLDSLPALARFFQASAGFFAGAFKEIPTQSVPAEPAIREYATT